MDLESTNYRVRMLCDGDPPKALRVQINNDPSCCFLFTDDDAWSAFIKDFPKYTADSSQQITSKESLIDELTKLKPHGFKIVRWNYQNYGSVDVEFIDQLIDRLSSAN